MRSPRIAAVDVFASRCEWDIRSSIAVIEIAIVPSTFRRGSAFFAPNGSRGAIPTCEFAACHLHPDIPGPAAGCRTSSKSGGALIDFFPLDFRVVRRNEHLKKKRQTSTTLREGETRFDESRIPIHSEHVARAMSTTKPPLVIPVRSQAPLPQPSRKYAPACGEIAKTTAQHPSPQKKRKEKRAFKKVTLTHASRLLYRFTVLLAAVCYVVISFKATADALGLLREEVGELVSKGMFTSDALGHYIGATTLRESPFVMKTLKNDTSPRNETIYLSANRASFDMCATLSPTAQALYSAAHLRSLYAAMARDTAYNLTFLAANATELIVPIVDCDLPIVTNGTESLGVFNFLVRSKATVDDVYILTVNFATQIYKINLQKEVGPAGVATVTFINDLRADTVKCHFVVSLGYPYEVFNFRVYVLTGLTARGSWIFQGIPNGDVTDLSKTVRVSTRSGFYIESDTKQANIFTERWLISNNPIQAITGPEWISKPFMFDSWAWTHFLHLYFGIDLLLSFLVLVVVVYRNFLSKKLWIGDAFVAVSTRTTLRGLLVVLSWYINGFWTLYEFCIYDTNEIAKVTEMAIYPWVIYADLLTIYFSVCGMLGMIFRERIDPLLAMLSFYIGFECRTSIVRWFPDVVQEVNEFSNEFYNKGMLGRIEDQTKISPMRFWVPHAVTNLPTNAIFSSLAPTFSTLGFVVLFIIFRKIYRFWFPQSLHNPKVSGQTSSAPSAPSGGEMSHVRERQSVLTLFEIATGATLANRFGLLAEYDNCLFIKGMKFATPDGIYSSGFVIVNKKFLIQANDIWAILFMKLTRTRYKNIYMYEVNGSTVEQKARLVYPDTFTLIDLLNLNTSILS